MLGSDTKVVWRFFFSKGQEDIHIRRALLGNGQGREAFRHYALVCCCCVQRAISTLGEYVYIYIVHTIRAMRIIASSFLLLTRSLLLKSPHHKHNTSLHPPRPLTAQVPTSNTKEQRPYLAFSASASGAQSVLADNPSVPVWC